MNTESLNLSEASFDAQKAGPDFSGPVFFIKNRNSPLAEFPET